jgi:hypothetical protein
VVSLVAVAIVLFLQFRAVFSLWFFCLETGTGQRLAANHVQDRLDASIKVICSLHVASNLGVFDSESPKGRP